LCAEIVSAAGRHLAPGGWAEVMVNWVETASEPWTERIARWAAGSGCDTWAIRRAASEPAAYAFRWLTDESPDPADRNERFAAWMAYYDAADVQAIGHGLVVLRETGGRPPWFRADDLDADFDAPCGEAIALTFDVQDWLDLHARDEDLLAAPLSLRADVRLDASYERGEGGWEPSLAVVRQEGGFESALRISPGVAGFLGSCDGRRPLSELLNEGAGDGGVEACRELVRSGFLVPAELTGDLHGLA
jgi:hypothetical protein